MLAGYQHPSYADALAEFGRPYQLMQSGGWILKRQIPGCAEIDGMGCYPFFACQDWSKLAFDLEQLSNELVSLAIVTDPFGTYDIDQLQHAFKDVVIPYKEHLIADLDQPLETFVSHHHRKYALQVLNRFKVDVCPDPSQFIEDWTALYATLIQRHHIKGISAFSKASFIKQLQVPGMVMLRAHDEQQTVGIILCYINGNKGYWHLGAYSSLGYKYRASYALVWSALKYCASEGLKYLNIGAGAGVKGDETDGLTQFKKGWANCSRRVYFCGRIFDHDKYTGIARKKDVPQAGYFPIYRMGEFN